MQSLKNLIFRHKKSLSNTLKKGFATWHDKGLPYEIALQNKKYGEIYMRPLNPDSPEDFEEFKDIVSQPKVALTSSWMDSLFGLENLENVIKNSKNPNEAIRDLMEKEEYREKVKSIYKDLTKYNEEYKLGYCGIYDDKGKTLFGGTGIVPTKIKNNQVVSCDVSLHIKPEYQQSGIGTDVMRKDLEYAFNEQYVPEIVGSSLKRHQGTPLVCARYGFIMEDVGKYKHYYINNAMWDVNQKGMSRIKDLKVASEIFKEDSHKSKLDVDSLPTNHKSSSISQITEQNDKSDKGKYSTSIKKNDTTAVNTKF